VDNFEPVIVVLVWGFLIIVTLMVFVMSLLGKDLVIFERYQSTAPKHYRNLKKSCRFSGPLVAITSIVGMVLSPLVATDSEGSVPTAIFFFAFSAIYLWLSIRWYLWAGRA